MTRVVTPLTLPLKGCLTLGGLRPVNNGQRIARAPFLTLAEKTRNSAVVQGYNASYVPSRCVGSTQSAWVKPPISRRMCLITQLYMKK